MPTYIALAQWSSKGVENIKESPARLQKAKEVVKAAGGELKAFYMTMGRYDMVIITEAPNDEAYARTMLALASAGAIRTQTLRAFNEDEYRKIVSSLP